jgi:hypothetical protein
MPRPTLRNYQSIMVQRERPTNSHPGADPLLAILSVEDRIAAVGKALTADQVPLSPAIKISALGGLPA